MVKLEETKDRRRLHIGSYFVDLNETDYQKLTRIFANEKVVKNLSSNLPVKSSFSREEVIKLLDWLRSSNFHNQGCNGWNQYGHSAYYGVGSDYVLREGEKNCF